MKRTLAALLLLTALATPAAAVPPTDDPATAAALAGGWLARTVGPDGAVAGFGGTPDVGSTVGTALGLAAAAVAAEEFERAVGYVEANAPTYAVDANGMDRPGALGNLLLLAQAAGRDPRSFAGEQPFARLEATRQPSGLYGAQPADFDGVFRQSLALLGLAAHDVVPDAAAVSWLVGQQCADGGWPAFRAETSTAPAAADVCGPDTPPDSNSTALAMQALAALGVAAEHDATAYLLGIQQPDGGFPFVAGSPTDANSTGLVIQAIVATGQDPAAAPWAAPEGTPLTALLALQLGCDAAPADRGAFAFQPNPDGTLTADAFATAQAVLGAARAPLPLGRRAPSPGDPFPACGAELIRVEGPTRVDTAVALARLTYPQGATSVLLADATDYADALAGAPLAAAEGAPLLLSEPDRLSEAVATALNDLGATRVLLLGGEQALSAELAHDVTAETGVAPERIGGATRFATAALIAERLGTTGGVYLTEGANPDPARGWPDALAVASLAAFQRRPILLTTAGVLPDETLQALGADETVTVVGGTSAVSDSVAAQVDAAAGAVERVAGTNRYATALAVTRLARSAGLDPSTSWFATGTGYADALAAGPAVAAGGGVLMLVDGQDAGRSGEALAYVDEVGAILSRVVLVGGEAAIAPGVAAALQAAASGVSG